MRLERGEDDEHLGTLGTVSDTQESTNMRLSLATALVLGFILASLSAPALAAEASTASLTRGTLPASEVTWTQVGNACSPCSPCAAPCPVTRDALCCSFRDWESCRWQFRVSLGMYTAGMKGTLGIRGRDFDLDMSPSDSLNAFFDYGEALLQGSIGVTKGRWSVEGVFSGMEFAKGAYIEQFGVEVDNTLTLIQWQAKIYYRVAETQLNCRPCPWLLVWEPMVGVRGNDVELKVNEPRTGTVSRSRSWADPVLGCRITWDLRNRWAFSLDGDVGGFGVSSDLTWRLRAAAAYRFNNWFALSAGWILLDTDYTDGTGNDRFTWDVLQSGPFLALNFMF